MYFLQLMQSSQSILIILTDKANAACLSFKIIKCTHDIKKSTNNK